MVPVSTFPWSVSDDQREKPCGSVSVVNQGEVSRDPRWDVAVTGADRQDVCVMSQFSAAMLWFGDISQVREHLCPSTAPLLAVFLHHTHLVHS